MSRSEFQGIIAREADRYRKLGASVIPAAEVFELLRRVSEIARRVQ